MASRWGASSWTVSSTWESDHLDPWVAWAWTWAWKVSGTTCSPALVPPIATQRMITGEQTRESLVSQRPLWHGSGLLDFMMTTETPLPNCLQDPTTFYSADICNVEAFHDCLLEFSMYPVMHRRSSFVQFRWPPVLTDPFPLWWALNSASLPLPTRIHMGSSMKSDCDWEHWRLQRHSVSFACTFGECSTWWHILDSLTSKRLPVKSTSLFGMAVMDQGEANVCIWQDTHKAKEVPLKKYSGLKHGRRTSKRKGIKS